MENKEVTLDEETNENNDLKEQGRNEREIQMFLATGKSLDLLEQKQPWLIPPNSTFYQVWDVLAFFFLVYTAIVTPFEIAFLPVSLSDPIFWFNRLCDLFFFLDTIFVFFTPYQDPNTNAYVVDHKIIAKRYLRFWFWIDIISLVPFDLISYLTNSGNVQHLFVLRLFRLLRLVRLLRLFRTSRILKRWAPLIPIRYSVMALIKFGIAMLLTAHWVACLMGLVPLLEGTTYSDRTPAQVASNYTPVNWYVAYFEGSLLYAPGSYGIWSIYLAGYYLAAMTLTTVGYGDVVPKTDAERGVMVIIMYVGGGFYAYAIGNIFSIISRLDQFTSEFHDTMDELNSFMSEVRLPMSLRRRVRRYFHFTLYHKRAMNNASLINTLPPALKRLSAYTVNKSWVDQLPFLHPDIIGDDRALVVAMSEAFVPRACGPSEILITKGNILNTMFVVDRGAVVLHVTEDPFDDAREDERIGSHLFVQKGIPELIRNELTTGFCFGHEMVYTLETEVNALYYATTLTYTEVFGLDRQAFINIIKDFPNNLTALKKYALRRNWLQMKLTNVVEDSNNEFQKFDIDINSLESDIDRLRNEINQVQESISEKKAKIRQLVE